MQRAKYITLLNSWAAGRTSVMVRLSFGAAGELVLKGHIETFQGKGRFSDYLVKSEHSGIAFSFIPRIFNRKVIRSYGAVTTLVLKPKDSLYPVVTLIPMTKS